MLRFDKKDEEIINKYIEQNVYGEIHDDEKLRFKAQVNNFQTAHEQSMIGRSRQYDDILESYTKNVSKTLGMKRIFKIIFFAFSILSLLFTLIVFLIVLYNVFKYFGSGKVNDWTIVATLVTSLASIITIYNVIPEIIAKYLFNIEEDKNMTVFIEKIQSYDSGIIGVINKREKKQDGDMTKAV